jgi:glycosyltransferase involved in cell wall biosynthesis
MQIVDVNPSDTGGQSFKLAQAINLNYYPRHQSLSFIRGNGYLDYPHMVKYNESWVSVPDWIVRYWGGADILHIHNKVRYSKGWASCKPNITIVMHQHGRVPWDTYALDQENSHYRIVSTINLLHYVFNDPSRWLPAPMRVKSLESIKRDNKDDHETIRIVHSPTMSGKRKNTDLFLKVMKKIQNKYKNVELILISNKTNRECLRIKSQCDICYDQLLLQYGTNALESWCFGCPVVCGGPEGTLENIKKIIGYLPFLEADENNLQYQLEYLIEDENARRKWGGIGKKYVEEWHDYPIVAERAISIYEDAG